jgi:hypothetical protein
MIKKITQALLSLEKLALKNNTKPYYMEKVARNKLSAMSPVESLTPHWSYQRPQWSHAYL